MNKIERGILPEKNASVRLFRYCGTLLWLAGLLLLLLAVSKMIVLREALSFAQAPDPVLPAIPARDARLIAACCELFVGLTLLIRESVYVKALHLIILSSGFLAYKMTFVLLKAALPCACLGVLETWLHMPYGVAEGISFLVLAVFLAIGYSSMHVLHLLRERH